MEIHHARRLLQTHTMYEQPSRPIPIHTQVWRNRGLRFERNEPRLRRWVRSSNKNIKLREYLRHAVRDSKYGTDEGTLPSRLSVNKGQEDKKPRGDVGAHCTSVDMILCRVTVNRDLGYETCMLHAGSGWFVWQAAGRSSRPGVLSKNCTAYVKMQAYAAVRRRVDSTVHMIQEDTDTAPDHLRPGLMNACWEAFLETIARPPVEGSREMFDLAIICLLCFSARSGGTHCGALEPCR